MVTDTDYGSRYVSVDIINARTSTQMRSIGFVVIGNVGLRVSTMPKIRLSISVL